MKYLLFFLWATRILALGEEESRVIIVGAGAAGIVAAAWLIEADIQNVMILEAENRVGGRIYSREIGEYVVDTGARAILGEDTVVLNMLEPFDFLSASPTTFRDELLRLQVLLSSDVGLVLSGFNSFRVMLEEGKKEPTELVSWKDYMDSILNEAFYKCAINPALRDSLMSTVELYTIALSGTDSWNDIAYYKNLTRDEISYTWEERTFDTVLEILMKRYPKPEEELPILNKTLLNKKVNKIKYNEDGPVRVTTADGDEYMADHVICTVSLGVLKSDYQTLFDPPLPEKHVNAIKNIEFAHEENVFFYYEEPWWSSDDSIDGKIFYWTEKDKKEIENDDEKSWILGVFGTAAVKNRPKLLSLIIGRSYYEKIKKIPEENLKNQTAELFGRFFPDFNDIGEPNDIMMTSWSSNENVRGSASYYSFKTTANYANFEDLAEPIMRGDVPILQFAGEATELGSSVNGAILSGWREARRLVHFYRKKV